MLIFPATLLWILVRHFNASQTHKEIQYEDFGGRKPLPPLISLGLGISFILQEQRAQTRRNLKVRGYPFFANLFMFVPVAWGLKHKTSEAKHAATDLP